MNKSFLVCFLLFLVILLSASMVSATRVSIGPGEKMLAVEETWELCYGYSLTVMSVDFLESPKQAWLVFSKDGVQLDNEVVEEGEIYSYEEIFNTKIDVIFAGMDSILVRLDDTNISSTSILTNNKTIAEGNAWNVCGGYSLTFMSANLETTPHKAWLVFSKDGIQLDDEIVDAGETYVYEDIFSAKVDTVFAGMSSNIVLLKDTFVSPSATGNPIICNENWNCSEWSSCVAGNQTRTCTDSSACGTENDKPTETQICTCSETWSCSEWTNWSECIDNSQNRTRTCSDSSACGTNVLKPVENETQLCESENCIENWSCGNWGNCVDGQKIRVCVDSSSCGTIEDKPDEIQSCLVSCEEEWVCSEWSSCVENKMTRTCKDAEDCETELNKPEEVKNCECQENWQCNVWSECINNVQTRICVDSSACGTLNEKLDTIKNCVSEVFIHEIEVSIQEMSQGGSVIKTKNASASTALKVVSDVSKVFVETSDGKKKELKVLPEEAVVKAKVTSANEIKIEEDKGNVVYVVSSTKNKRFIFLFPVTFEIEVKVNVETGQVVSVKEPWWAFLAW